MKILKDLKLKGGLIDSDRINVGHLVKKTKFRNTQHEMLFFIDGVDMQLFSFTITVPQGYIRIDPKGDDQKLEIRFTGSGAHFQPYRKRDKGIMVNL